MLVGATSLIALGLLSGSSCSANSSTETQLRQRYVVAQAQGAQVAEDSSFERPTLDEIPLREAEPQVQLSEEEWRARLTPAQYQVLREEGTERAGSGELLHVKEDGTFVCAACGQELFSSDHKYDSRTGWPSFYAPISEEAVGTKMDTSHGMRRVEVHCSRCGGHLGHIFPDGPAPTGLRYCVNSASMGFTPADEAPADETPADEAPAGANSDGTAP
ncbi:peptide-methionine (R)-S-oxide reductase [Lujinxingia sediminis]|uniref:Peptide methionine sulfoxide reductase MsrB n=1 Tax=Lujinxingia sediminis TaxID=2480984 RepID=A0ABY0CUC7_9DELT|nr:peptide-methionine (R)-S-oxide reductase [Lujinxingia sediminis]